MAFLNEQGLARLWTHIVAKLNSKIDKEEGKTLSTNDYTNEDKEKLNNLDEIYAKADEVLTQDVTDSEQGNAVMANADLLGGVLASQYALKDEIPSLDEYALKDEVSPINHTHTYDDVGAAAVNHTHTYNDVGAAAAAHTHTYGDIGAASVDHTHTAANVGALSVDGTAVDAEKLGGYHASNYAKKEDVPSIEGLATKEYVDSKVSNVDLSNYATKDELQDYALPKNERATDSFKLGGVIASEYALKTDIPEIHLTFDNVYPIGSIYMSMNDTSPASMFGGTWEQLKNRFLLGAGSEYSLGETGGEATHTLTVNEMPSHEHSVFQGTSGSGGNAVANKSSSATRKIETYDAASMWFASGNADIGQTAWVADILANGGSQAHNNMPPYLAVNIWKRVG